MWYEILPSMAIIVAAVSAPQAIAYFGNKFFLGNPYRRDISHPVNTELYLRDTRLTGSPYTMKGLENIPDA